MITTYMILKDIDKVDIESLSPSEGQEYRWEVKTGESEHCAEILASSESCK